MGTRSSILMLNDNNMYERQYVQFDGHIHHVGKVLFKHYQNIDKIKKLMTLGSMQSIHPDVKPVEGRVYNPENMASENGYSIPFYTFLENDLFHIDTPIENMMEHSYLYLFEDGQWYVYTSIGQRGKYYPNPKKQLLTQALIDSYYKFRYCH